MKDKKAWKSLLLDYLKINKKITTNEYQKLIDKSEITAERYLIRFKKEGLINFEGSLKTGYYTLRKK